MFSDSKIASGTVINRTKVKNIVEKVFFKIRTIKIYKKII